jgi:hypothetical protein
MKNTQLMNDTSTEAMARNFMNRTTDTGRMIISLTLVLEFG